MTEPIDKEPAASEPQSQPPPKRANALSGIRRDLTDEELSTAGARKLLIDRLDQLEAQVVELKGYRDQFHAADREVAVLTQKIKGYTAHEVVYGVALAVGSVLVSLSPIAWEKQPLGWLSLLAGIVLMGGAIISKVLLR